ncbi:thiol:disulfide interchange protein DsbA/DsbL [Marinimicrobium sp. ABcell2]|uniref:thiol:disulfide interchange protein DsbA/DsbL n=1 Tax=Marinimicrobium sp. ABcell2 TaxID=3069751 RepID=UPI0027B866CD|nr:thiol:disulfide interchange protein DsbA/DsbL [Marinimicrobium sp. ABcell2]MDQ2076223.1 thiol:disulfide interchange protein DsbA/DsbL [Marinimicrobium sp. ABcell2]
MRILTGLLVLTLSMAAMAQQTPTQYQAGRHYEVLSTPVPTSDPDKIEVVEIFSYLCGHCFTFAPLVSAWEERQKDDVVLVHAHAVWAPAMEAYARGLHTAKALGIFEEVHMPIFTAVHQERKQMTTPEQWADFLASYGADREEALKTYGSMGVTRIVRRDTNRIRNQYGIRGTPEIVVDGKYRITAGSAGTHSEMLRIVDFLVEKIRAENE